MSVKYKILKRLVRLAGIKKRWLSKATEELIVITGIPQGSFSQT